MIAATGVSRTVVREAVAALRADGLVVTRQGVGAFVPENARRPLRIDFDQLSPLRAVLDVMELRTGIEIEAAGLAADRASAAQMRRIVRLPRCRSTPRSGAARTRSRRISRSIAASPTPPAIRSSGAFWSISDASSSRARPSAAAPACPSGVYRETFQREHRDIVQAIRSGAVAQARAAMRRHLLNSRKRYQRLAAKLGSA